MLSIFTPLKINTLPKTSQDGSYNWQTKGSYITWYHRMNNAIENAKINGKTMVNFVMNHKIGPSKNVIKKFVDAGYQIYVAVYWYDGYKCEIAISWNSDPEILYKYHCSDSSLAESDFKYFFLPSNLFGDKKPTCYANESNVFMIGDDQKITKKNFNPENSEPIISAKHALMLSKRVKKSWIALKRNSYNYLGTPDGDGFYINWFTKWYFDMNMAIKKATLKGYTMTGIKIMDMCCGPSISTIQTFVNHGFMVHVSTEEMNETEWCYVYISWDPDTLKMHNTACGCCYALNEADTYLPQSDDEITCKTCTVHY